MITSMMRVTLVDMMQSSTDRAGAEDQQISPCPSPRCELRDAYMFHVSARNASQDTAFDSAQHLPPALATQPQRQSHRYTCTCVCVYIHTHRYIYFLSTSSCARSRRTPDSKVRKAAGRGFVKNWALDMRVNFAWLCMLSSCIFVEVCLLLPTMKGLDWNMTCGLDLLGDVTGLPSQRGACTESAQVLAFGCVTCVSSVLVGWLLVMLGGLVDIYFIFYLASAVVGSVMGHKRHLNDLKNTSLPIDLHEHQGNEAVRACLRAAHGPRPPSLFCLPLRPSLVTYLSPRSPSPVTPQFSRTRLVKRAPDLPATAPKWVETYPMFVELAGRARSQFAPSPGTGWNEKNSNDYHI